MAGFAFLAIFIGVLTLFGLYLLVRQLERQGVSGELRRALANQPIVENDPQTAVIVVSEAGIVLHINDLAREWLQLEESANDLEIISSLASPQDHFLALLSGETQTSFALRGRWVTATSHMIPEDRTWRTMLMMRELVGGAGDQTPQNNAPMRAMNVSLAMNVIKQIGETVTGGMNVDQTLQLLLEIINRALHSDGGEICLWNAPRKFLEQRGWVGDMTYLLLVAESGGGYSEGQGVAGWMTQAKRSLLVRGERDRAGVGELLIGSAYQSAVGVPLSNGSRFIGTLTLFSTRANTYRETDIAFLEAISNSVATTIYNATLYTQQEQRINEISRLQEIAQDSSSDSDSRALFAELNRRIAQLVEADMSGVFIHDAERELLTPQLPFHGLNDSVASMIIIPLTANSPQRAVWENQPYWVSNDLRDEPLAEALGFQSVIEVAGIRNTALIPMEIAGNRIGFIAVSNRRDENGFTPLDIQRLRVLSTQAGIVVTTLRLHQRENLIESELMGLQEMTQAIGSLSHEGEFYGTITERIARLMRSDSCGVLLYNPDTRQLEARTPIYGIPDAIATLYKIKIPSNSIIEELWQDADFWFSNRVATDTLVFEASLDALAEQAGIKRTLFAVMSAGGRRIGVVQVSNTTDGRDYTDKDARLLQIFATQAGAIIENARLYREVQFRAEQADTLRRVAELASSVITPTQSFEPVLRAISGFLDSPVVFINVVDQSTFSLITYPRWTYGMDISEPVIQDLSSPEFKHSVALSGRTFLSNDLVSDLRVIPSYRQVAQRIQLQRAVLVPLFVGERNLGEIGVANRTDRPYNNADVVSLSTVASQIAAALERLLLYEATGENLRRRMQELDAIARVSNELAVTVDLDKVLEAIRAELRDTMTADDTTIALIAPVEAWESSEMPRVQRRLGITDMRLADIEKEAVLRGSETVLIDDYGVSAFAPQPTEARSAVAVAVHHLERVVAVIHAVAKTPHRFDERSAGFLMTIASKAALAYQNAEYYQQQLERGERLRQRVDQLNRIFELGQMLQASNSDPIMLLEAVAYSVQQSVGFDVVLMLLVDEQAGVLRRVAHAGLPLDAFESTKNNVMSLDLLGDFLKPEFRISETYFFPIQQIAKWFMDGTEALSTAYEQNRSIDGSQKDFWQDGDKLLVNISGQGGNLLGVMVLDRPYSNRRPDRAVIEVLEVFAHQASTMIENTRLFMESKRSAEQEAQFNAIMNAVSSTLDLTEITHAVADGLSHFVPFERMTLLIASPQNDGFDYLRVRRQAEGTYSLQQDTRTAIERTALGRTYRDRAEYAYRVGDDGVKFYEDLKAWFATGEQASVITPLIAGGDCLGAMHIGSSTPDALIVPDVRRNLARIAQIVASSLQNARLFNQAINLQILNRSVVESIQQGIVVLDPSGRIININEFMRVAYGWGNDALRQDLFTYRPALSSILGDDVRAVLEQGVQRESLNNAVFGTQNKTLVTNFYIYPLRSGEIIRGAVLLADDVTERTKLEEAIEARANQLAALTEVSTRITSLLERDEIIRLALDEMGWMIPFDTMSIWRRNGSYMVLEGSSGLEDNTGVLGYRLKIDDNEHVHQLVASQRVVTLSDAGTLPLLPDDSVVMGSLLGVPLVNQGHVVGMMLLTRHDAGFYTTREEHHVSYAFASQVAIALANADLFEQTFERTNELGTLLEAAQATALTRNLNEVLKTVANLMFTALEQEDCAVMIWHEVDNYLEVEYAQSRLEDAPHHLAVGARLPMKRYPAHQRALSMRDVVVIVDLPDSPSATVYPQEIEALRQLKRGARMLVPLVAGDQTIGLLQVEQLSSDERTLTQQKVRLAKALGSQLAIAIENSRLSTETNLRFEELLTINTLSQRIASTLNVDEILPIVRDQITPLTKAEEMYLALYDAEKKHITFPLVIKNGKTALIPSRPLGTDEVSYIITRKHSLNLGADYFSIDDLRKSMHISNGEGDLKSYMGVPLISNDQVVGVLAIRNVTQQKAFTLNEERILSTIGGQLASAIQNSRLFQKISNFADDLNRLVELRTNELEEERDRLDTLYQITSELARTLDMEQLLERALGMVTKAVSADDAVIMLSDPATDMLYCRAWIDPRNLVNEPESPQVTHPAMAFAEWFLLNSDEHDHVVMVDDLLEQDYWEKDHPSGLRSALAVMLENNEDPMGVMVLLSKRVGAFTENHLQLIVPAANQVAASINSADLYQLIRDQAERLGRLLRAEQEEAQKQGAILEGINDGVMLADASGKIVLFNSAAERILQIPRSQVMNQPVSKLATIFGDSAFQWINLINELSESIAKKSALEELESERIQLNEFFVSTYLSPIYSADQFLGVVAAFRDVTKDVEAERTKNSFITSVSHEFRTPLTPIKGYTDLLLMGAGGQLSDMQLSMVMTIKENVERLTLLVNDVLNIAKIDNREASMIMTMVNLAEILPNIVDQIAGREMNVKKRFVTTVFVDPNVPRLRADRDKLIQIISNLVDNAFKYTRAGGKIDVQAALEADRKHILIRVQDTGVGIPDHFKEAAWRRFERYDEHALELDVAGTGLGLSLVKELVELHHGETWFESELGKGSTFFVRLPIEQPNYTTETYQGITLN